MTDDEYAATIASQLRDAANATLRLPVLRDGMSVAVSLHNDRDALHAIEIHDTQPDDLETVAALADSELSSSTDADGIRRWASVKVHGFDVTYYRRS